MTNLSVNINKIATLRNSRGENIPDVVAVAVDCQRFGADGITVHPRPDERHIRTADVWALRPVVHEFNVEGYPSENFMSLVIGAKPEQVTLVPDAPGVLTSCAGWNVGDNFDFLTNIVERLHDAGIRTSIFVDASVDSVLRAAETGTDRIELYTKPYADQFARDREAAVEPYTEASRAAHKAGLGVNAGHDLNLANLSFFRQRVPFLDEVSIGHAIICDALYLGLETTIAKYKECLIK